MNIDDIAAKSDSLIRWPTHQLRLYDFATASQVAILNNCPLREDFHNKKFIGASKDKSSMSAWIGRDENNRYQQFINSLDVQLET